MKNSGFARFFVLVVVCALGSLLGCASSTKTATTPRMPKKEMKQAMEQLPEKYKQFLADVEPLISDEEKNIFLQLHRDFERDELIERFWNIRSLNEDGVRIPFREIYYSRLALIQEMRERPSYNLSQSWLMALATRSSFDKTRDPARIFLLNGPPDGSKQIECENVTWPIQIWQYAYVPTLKKKDIVLVFYRPGNFDYQLWLPQDGIQALMSNPTLSMGAGARQGIYSCTEWRDILAATNMATAQMDGMMAAKTAADLTTGPVVSIEGSEKVLWMTTDVDPRAPKLTFRFFGFGFTQGMENQNKSTVGITFAVLRDQLAVRELAGEKFYNLDVILRVIEKRDIGDRRFSAKRFRFDFRVEDTLPAELPITVEEEIYPGAYVAFVKFIDANDKNERQAGWEDKVQVPYVEVRVRPQMVPSPASKAELSAVKASNPLLPVTQSAQMALNFAPISGKKNEQAISPIILLPPGRNPLLGIAVFEARIAKDILPFVSYVDFFVNLGKSGANEPKTIRKHTPPFGIELNMGPVPRRQTVSVVAFDLNNKELCRYELGVNQGAHSFFARLIAPTGLKADGETKFQAAIFAPDDHTITKVQFYLNDEALKPLYHEPWVLTAKIRSDTLTSVRVVATLDNGTIAEDMRYVNLPGFASKIDVNVVELFVVVKDGGDIAENLKAKNFEISEDGVPQKIEAFEYAKNSPITVGVVVDTSGSMKESLLEVQKAAIGFLGATLRPQDRGFTMDFNVAPNMLMPLTDDKKKLTLSLAGLRAEGGTAIYDTLMQALYEVQDVQGKKALVLLTDGEDNRSDYDFATAREYAKRSGVSVYTIGFRINRSETKAKLNELARVSGGKAYFVNTAEELKGTYKEIELELRSQYIITYYSHSGTKNWRSVEVKMTPKNFKVRTIAGYYP